MNSQNIETQIRNLINAINACTETQYVVVSNREGLPEYIYTSTFENIKGKERFFSYAEEDATGWCLPLELAQGVADTLNEQNADLGVHFEPVNAREYFTKNLEAVHDMILAQK